MMSPLVPLRHMLRTLRRERGYALLNVLGLAIGLAACLLMLSYVRDDLLWDSFHEKGDRIYRVNQLQSRGVEIPQHVAWTMVPMAPAIVDEMAEVVAATRYKPRSAPLLSIDDNERTVSSSWYVDPSFFQIFSFPLLYGDSASLLDRPDAIVLAREEAEAFFGEANALGRTLLLDGQREVTVTGVLDEPPSGSHIEFNALLPFEAYAIDSPNARFDHWGQNNLITYVLLAQGVGQPQVEAKLDSFFAAHRNIEGTDFYLQPIADMHLHSSHMRYDHNIGSSDMGNVLLSIAIGLLLLGIAVVNYINLATSRSLRRAREIGLRKVVGASRRQLGLQLLGESFALVLLALLIALGLIELAEPLFAELAGRAVDFRITDLSFGLPLALGLTLLVTLLAGLYPAAVLSSHRPAVTLRGRTGSAVGGGTLRRILVVVQFAATSVLLITTGVVLHQLAYAQSKELGFDREHVLRVISTGPDFWEQGDRYRELFAQVEGVEAVSLTSGMPGLGGGQTTVYPEGVDEDVMAGYLIGDAWTQQTFGLELASGRWFRADSEAERFGMGDSVGAVIINETFVRQLGWDDPLGRIIKAGSENELTVVGVVRDFHFTDLRERIEPVIIFNGDFWRSTLAIRFEAGALPGVLDRLEQRWDELFPGRPFEYQFFDERFDQLYRSETQLASLLRLFAGLGIAVASLGLIGLAAHATSRRRHEMSVRKVLGAAQSELLMLLSREFLLLVLIANLIAWPVAWYAASRWLEGFAYHASMPLWIYPLAALGTMLVAWLAILWQTLRTARSNPAQVLRAD